MLLRRAHLDSGRVLPRRIRMRRRPLVRVGLSARSPCARWFPAGVCIGSIALLALLAGRVRAEPWGSVFAAESDTTFFLFQDGVVVRAPFHLGSPETLWTCPAGQHVVRFVTSPRGGRIAWTSRSSDPGDTTRLWIGSARGAERRLSYFAMQPRRHGHEYAEPSAPTIADPSASGARLIRGNTRLDGPCANSLVWTSNGRSVVVGYDGGIAGVVPGTQGVSRLTSNFAVKLEPVPPSRWILADVLLRAPSSQPQVSQFELDRIVLFGGNVSGGRVAEPLRRRRMLVGLGPESLLVCHAPRWITAKVRTAGHTKLWWAEDRQVRALRTGDCAAADIVVTSSEVRWLGYDPAHRQLLGLSGRRLWRIDEEGGTPEPVLEAASGVRGVITSPGVTHVALVTHDSLLVWTAGTDRVRRLRRRGPVPDGLFAAPGGALVTCSKGPFGWLPVLARAEAADGGLQPIEIPRALRSAVVQATTSGRWILLMEPGAQPPRNVLAYDLASGLWHTVENPGISAWEPSNGEETPHTGALPMPRARDRGEQRE